MPVPTDEDAWNARLHVVKEALASFKSGGAGMEHTGGCDYDRYCSGRGITSSATEPSTGFELACPRTQKHPCAWSNGLSWSHSRSAQPVTPVLLAGSFFARHYQPIASMSSLW